MRSTQAPGSRSVRETRGTAEWSSRGFGARELSLEFRVLTLDRAPFLHQALDGSGRLALFLLERPHVFSSGLGVERGVGEPGVDSGEAGLGPLDLLQQPISLGR